MLTPLHAAGLAGTACYFAPRLLERFCSQPRVVDMRVAGVFDRVRESLLCLKQACVWLITDYFWNFGRALCENAWPAAALCTYLFLTNCPWIPDAAGYAAIAIGLTFEIILLRVLVGELLYEYNPRMTRAILPFRYSVYEFRPELIDL